MILQYSVKFDTILEIGPGAGRWSGKLVEICDNLILVDQSETCIDILKQKFSRNKKVNCILNNGKKLTTVENNSIDFIWSFDVFVHIDEITTESYIAEFHRVMKKNGIAIIHHPKKGGSAGGWRSNTSSEKFLEILSKNGLKLTSQVDSWGDREQFNLMKHNDIISIFAK
ncbi:class I SAM-dependent methyltransferase [Bacteroidota bacterium]